MGVLPAQALVLLHELLLQQCPLHTSRVCKIQRRTKKLLDAVRVWYSAYFETEVIYKCFVVFFYDLSQLQLHHIFDCQTRITESYNC